MDAHREEEVRNNLVNNSGGNGNLPPALPQNHNPSSEVERRVEFVVERGEDIRSQIFNFMDSNGDRSMYVFETNVHVSTLSISDEPANGVMTFEGDFIINDALGSSSTWVSNDGIHHRFREVTITFSHPTRGLLIGVATGPLIAASPVNVVLHIYNGPHDSQGWGRQRVRRLDSGTATRFGAVENGLANGHVPNQAESSHAGSNGHLHNRAGPNQAGSNHAGSNGHLPNHVGPSHAGSNHAGSNGHLPNHVEPSQAGSNHAGSNGHLPSHVGPRQAGSNHAGSNGHLPNHVEPSQAGSSNAGSNGRLPNQARSNGAGSNHIGPNYDDSNNVGSNHAGPNHDG